MGDTRRRPIELGQSLPAIATTPPVHERPRFTIPPLAVRCWGIPSNASRHLTSADTALVSGSLPLPQVFAVRGALIALFVAQANADTGN